MFLRDTYAMFCFGIFVDNDDVAQLLIDTYPNLKLDQRRVGGVLLDLTK